MHVRHCYNKHSLTHTDGDSYIMGAVSRRGVAITGRTQNVAVGGWMDGWMVAIAELFKETNEGSSTELGSQEKAN